MNEGRSQISLLAEDETQQAVHLGVAFVETKRFRERLPGRIQITSGGGLLAAFVEIVRRTRRDGTGLTRGLALLISRHSE
jgi:hypothetical protein